MKLSIALPGLLYTNIGNDNYITSQIKCKNFSKLVKKSSIAKLPFNFSDLIYSLQVDNITDSLAKSIAYDNGFNKDYSHFLIAEPTFLRTDMDRLLICESELLQLSDEENHLILDTINQHFNGLIKIYQTNQNIWLIGLNMDISEIKFYPILDIIGENIDEYLPIGKNALELTKIINEIQMVLFNLNINHTRKQEGLLQINSLWLWDKSIKFSILDNYSQIFTNSIGQSNAKIKDIPQNIEDSFIDNSLIIIDDLYYPSCYRDSYSYIQHLEILDRILAKLLLQKKEITSIEILIPNINNTLAIKIGQYDRYKFWKNMSFIQLMKEQNAV